MMQIVITALAGFGSLGTAESEMEHRYQANVACIYDSLERDAALLVRGLIEVNDVRDTSPLMIKTFLLGDQMGKSRAVVRSDIESFERPNRKYDEMSDEELQEVTRLTAQCVTLLETAERN